MRLFLNARRQDAYLARLDGDELAEDPKPCGAVGGRPVAYDTVCGYTHDSGSGSVKLRVFLLAYGEVVETHDVEVAR